MLRLIMLMGLVGQVANAQSPLPDVDRVVNAIWVAEGGSKTRYPYGIKSVRFRDAAHAREICRRTVVRAIADWRSVGWKRQPDFIRYLGQRYCPPGVDPRGHENWVRNVSRLIRSS